MHDRFPRTRPSIRSDRHVPREKAEIIIMAAPKSQHELRGRHETRKNGRPSRCARRICGIAVYPDKTPGATFGAGARDNGRTEADVSSIRRQRRPPPRRTLPRRKTTARGRISADSEAPAPFRTDRPQRSGQTKKADNSVELSALVAGGGLEPPTSGL